jgi:serine/threonine-protein kinase
LGLDRGSAQDELTLAGFTVTDSTCLAPSAPEGVVVQQTPAGGIGAPEGSNVEICLSIRQLPFQSPGADGEAPAFGGTGTVPNVVGESRARAHSTLNPAGYDMASVRECDPGGGSDSGKVWKQDPAPGTKAAEGSTVTIWYNPAACG